MSELYKFHEYIYVPYPYPPGALQFSRPGQGVKESSEF